MNNRKEQIAMAYLLFVFGVGGLLIAAAVFAALGPLWTIVLSAFLASIAWAALNV